jgi:anaerobic ribonucleoside-triphosphate reductase activating protein
MRIRVAALHSGITSLGPGRRMGVWVSGCSLRCPGCASAIWWDHEAGYEWSTSALAVWLSGRADEHDGITISGGEPFEQAGALESVLGNTRRSARHLNVVVYSGHTLADLRRGPEVWQLLLEQCDILVAGRFVRGTRSRRPWVGSPNQRVHACSSRGRELREQFWAKPTRTSTTLQLAASPSSLSLIGIASPQIRHALASCGLLPIAVASPVRKDEPQ